MTRRVTRVLGFAALVLLAGLWFGVRSFTGEPSRPGARAAARGETVEDLMMDLQVIPPSLGWLPRTARDVAYALRSTLSRAGASTASSSI